MACLNQPLRTIPRPTPPTAGTCDLGELALLLLIRSLGCALLGIVAACVVLILGSIAGIKWMGNFWQVAFAVWAILQAELFLRLWRIARQAPAVITTNHSIHKLELSMAGFLFLFWLARPYLIEEQSMTSGLDS